MAVAQVAGHNHRAAEARSRRAAVVRRIAAVRSRKAVVAVARSRRETAAVAAVHNRRAADSSGPAMVAGAAAEALREIGGADREEGWWVDCSYII